MIAERIATYQDGWAGPWVEDEIFGTHDPAQVADAFEAFARRELGARFVEFVFYEASVGCVLGARLEDGRGVVVKAQRPGVDDRHLTAAAEVQQKLAERGFPCPRPLLPPRRLGAGIATVEELIDEGERRDAHEPVIRRCLAEALARLVETAADLVETPGLDAGLLAAQRELWPTPHSRIFDFDATRNGTEWIDTLAGQALEALRERTGEIVVGHVDWTVRHCRFVADELRVVYDWDSLAVLDEPRLVGEAARAFTTTWYLDVRVTPTPEEASAFVAEYEAARGRRFTRTERARLAAAATYALAYTARCESCGDPAATDFPPGSAREALARYGADYLSR